MSTGETTILRRPTFLPSGRAVAAGRGWDWISESWRIFKSAPGPWLAVSVIFLLVLVACVYAPLVASTIAAVLYPAFAAGAMIVCAKIDAKETPAVSDLLAGFRGPAGKLLTIGVIFCVASLLVLMVAGLVVKASGSTLPTSEQLQSAHMDPEMLYSALAATLLYLLVALALHLPLLMASWFAAPLVMFHDLGALDAMKRSFGGCLRNAVPFLLYGVVALLLAIPATLSILLGWLVLIPMLAATIYTGYKDIYLSQ